MSGIGWHNLDFLIELIGFLASISLTSSLQYYGAYNPEEQARVKFLLWETVISAMWQC